MDSLDVSSRERVGEKELERELILSRLSLFERSFSFNFSEPEKMKSMSQLAVLTRRWSPAHMRLEPFQEVVLESSSVEELKEKVCVCVRLYETVCVRDCTAPLWPGIEIILPTKCCPKQHQWV